MASEPAVHSIEIPFSERIPGAQAAQPMELASFSWSSQIEIKALLAQPGTVTADE